MVNVLILASVAPARPAVFTEALEQFRSQGATVRVGCYFELERLAPVDGLAETHQLPTPARAEGLRRPVLLAEPARRMWLMVRNDSWLRRHAAQADVIVAVDWRAVYTVWRLAQRNRHADAVYGIAPSVTAVEKRLQNPVAGSAVQHARNASPLELLVTDAKRSTTDVARTVAVGATSSTVMRVGVARRAWKAALAVPGIPDGPRAKLARRIQESMTRAGHAASAAGAAVAATRHLRDPQVRAELLGPLTDAELAQGQVPSRLADVAAGELASADALYRKRDIPAAISATGAAMDRIFHRVLHFDGLASPIAEDPEGFLAPFHRSAVGQALARPRGRNRPAAAPPTDRPHRLLLLTGLNDNFGTPIRERYEHLPQVEVRTIDVSTGPARELVGNGREKLIADGLAGRSAYAEQARRVFGPDLEWADTVFVDWCTAHAGLLSLVDPGDTRVVVRLHSFEAFSWWPHLVDYSRVDDLVFVSEHLRDLTTSVVPRLRGPGAPRTHVVGNAMDLRRYPAEKIPGARFTLGLVGIGAVAKDPRWAMRVLRILRDHDPRYRLLLIGAEINAAASPAAELYRRAYDQDVAELERGGAVRRLGQLDDVPRALTEVGIILSSSVRESFHCALVEGAASGAVPVVRNWPFFAGRPRGAHTLFPADWVVDSPEEAARRVLAVTATEQGWREAGRDAAAQAIGSWDWRVTRRDFDRLLLGAPIDDEPA